MRIVGVSLCVGSFANTALLGNVCGCVFARWLVSQCQNEDPIITNLTPGPPFPLSLL